MQSLFALVPMALAFLWIAPLFPLLYVVLRWRARGEGEPGVGSYALSLFFASGALLAATGAAATLLYCAWSDRNLEDLLRATWGIFAAGGTFLLLQAFLGAILAPSDGGGSARRIFGGFLMGITGFVVFVGLIAVFILWFQDTADMSPRALSERDDFLKLSVAWLGVFGLVYGLTVRGMRPA